MSNATIDGKPVTIAGYVAAFPHHPGADAVAPTLATENEIADAAADGTLYGLVSVVWATPVTTVDTDKGTSETKFVPNFLGIGPGGITWYLRPVDRAADGTLTLRDGMARSNSTATLGETLRAVLDGTPEAAPAAVHVHDFALFG